MMYMIAGQHKQGDLYKTYKLAQSSSAEHGDVGTYLSTATNSLNYTWKEYWLSLPEQVTPA